MEYTEAQEQKFVATMYAQAARNTEARYAIYYPEHLEMFRKGKALGYESYQIKSAIVTATLPYEEETLESIAAFWKGFDAGMILARCDTTNEQNIYDPKTNPNIIAGWIYDAL